MPVVERGREETVLRRCLPDDLRIDASGCRIVGSSWMWLRRSASVINGSPSNARRRSSIARLLLPEPEEHHGRSTLVPRQGLRAVHPPWTDCGGRAADEGFALRHLSRLDSGVRRNAHHCVAGGGPVDVVADCVERSPTSDGGLSTRAERMRM